MIITLIKMMYHSLFPAPQGEAGNVGSAGLKGEKVSNIKRNRTESR